MIPVIADVPCKNPGLGFQEYADAIADAVRGGEPAQFTIGLYGPWGSGKSSLLNAIAENLGRDGSDVIPVLFDAWRHERSEHIIVPILYAIYESVEAHGNATVSDAVKRALQAVLYSLTFSIDKIGLKISAKDVKERWDTEGLPALDAAFSKPFAELRRIPKLLNRQRIAVLIDDLDRCSSDKVVSVLESINLVMDIPGFIFVLALDYDVLVSAIATKYSHVSGDAFIQKMVQIPFRVPALSLDRADFLAELVPNWSKWKSSVPKKFAATVHDIASLGFDANPRQIKRLINSFLLVHRVAVMRKIEFDFELMTALIGVQLQWPSVFSEFQDDVLSGRGEPFDVFFQDDQEAELQRYAKRFFSRTVPNPELKAILQFTAVVTVEESAPAANRASEIRETNRIALVSELVRRGFKKKLKTSRIYYHDGNAGIRIAVTKTVARFETGSHNDWSRVRSYLLTSQIDAALQALDGLNLSA